MQWIFGSLRRDLCFLILPGLLALVCACFPFFQESVAYLFFVTVFIDSGHVYTTVWRTWFHPAERRRSALSWTVPLAVAVTFFAWGALQLPYMWSFVVYATLHHNIKQYFGVTRWYETLNRSRPRWSGFFSKALMLLPVLAYHFRSIPRLEIYGDRSLFLFPNPSLLAVVVAAYLVVLTAWVTFEVAHYRRGQRDLNRVLSIAFSSTIYAGSFFFGVTLTQVLFPPIIGHGLGYIAMTALALQRTRKVHFATFAKAAGVLVVTAMTFGVLEHLTESTVIDFSATQSSLGAAAVTGLYLVPLFSHFIYDSWLWKRTHWESRLVYGLASEPLSESAQHDLPTKVA